MAKPAAPSVCTRMLYYPAVPPAAGAGAVPANDITGQAVALPALVVSLAGSAPDYLGMVLAVYGPDGVTYLRSGMVNIATWQSAGSSRFQARWDYVDALA